MIRFDLFTWAQALEDAFDVLVIGGGATDLGVPLQAALEGSQVALEEVRDFACGTSSRSTHLLHGGVLSIWVGLRPLVGAAQGGGSKHAPNSTFAPERPDRSRSAGFCHRDRWQMEDLLRLGPRGHGGAVAELLREKTGIDPDLSGFIALCRQYRLQEAVA